MGEREVEGQGVGGGWSKRWGWGETSREDKGGGGRVRGGWGWGLLFGGVRADADNRCIGARAELTCDVKN